MTTLPKTSVRAFHFGDVTTISQNLLEAGRPLQGINSPASGIFTLKGSVNEKPGPAFLVKIYLIINFLLLFPIICHANDWSKEDIAREAAWMSLHTIDWGQTLEIARHPKEFSEINPILGKHPSVGNVNLYMGAWAIVHPVVSYILPKEWRKAWQYISIGISSTCVINNFHAD